MSSVSFTRRAANALVLGLVGPMGRIYRFVRHNDRCPASDFLQNLDSQNAKKFKGSFDALSKMGAAYRNDQRFKGLASNGKPLWEFKEHDHRLYCFRSIASAEWKGNVWW